MGCYLPSVHLGYDSVIKPVLDQIAAAWQALAASAMAVFTGIVARSCREVWDVSAAASAAWSRIVTTVTGTSTRCGRSFPRCSRQSLASSPQSGTGSPRRFRACGESIKTAAKTAVDWVLTRSGVFSSMSSERFLDVRRHGNQLSRASGIKSKTVVAKPINFIIDTVYTNGLKSLVGDGRLEDRPLALTADGPQDRRVRRAYPRMTRDTTRSQQYCHLARRSSSPAR